MRTIDPTAFAAILQRACDIGATDVLLHAGSPPLLRVEGDLIAIPEAEVLSAADTASLVESLLGADGVEVLQRERERDLSFDWADQARFRGNIYFQRGSMAMTLRRLAVVAPSAEELNLPQSVMSLLLRPKGLILVTGPTGAGKSTTQAAMIDWINRRRRWHIVTIEDPIEYVHQAKLSVVSQREVGSDTATFASALRSAFREDPDVLLVGEMRDLESMQSVLTLAETGHLVFATVHTNDAATALDRIIDAFDSERHAQIRLQLAASLVGVVAQRLVPRRDGGNVAAFEVMVANSAVRNLIRHGRTAQIRNVIATSLRDGMHTLEWSLSSLVASGEIARENALAIASHPDEIA